MDNNMNSNNPNKTCGHLFFEAVSQLGCNTYKNFRSFIPGFLTGLCEKVHLGACIAAMSRPPKEDQSWVLSILNKLCQIYNLEISMFEGSDEIWIHRSSNTDKITKLNTFEVNSPGYHRYRAYLCGIPENEIDVNFHTRYTD